jgi:hypothetical protein
MAIALGHPQAADASASVDHYWITRDRYIAAENDGYKAHTKKYEQVLKESGYHAAETQCGAGACRRPTDSQENAWLNDLHAQLIKIIDPPSVRGFTTHSELNLTTLYPELGFGMLDGLSYTSDDKSIALVESTEDLVTRWLHFRRELQDDDQMPQDIIGALRSDVFYTFAITSDVRVSRFAEIPVHAPAGATFAFAILALETSDYAGSGPPDEIIASVIAHGRVFIFKINVANVRSIALCDAIWSKYASNPSDKAVEYGSRRARRCFADHWEGQSYHNLIAAQAQQLVDHVAQIP